MNSSLTRNRLVLSKERTKEFRKTILEIWSKLEIPTDSNESWRKFPLASVDWKELKFDPKEISTKITDESASEPSLVDETVDGILSDILKYIPKDYFAYLSLVVAPSYELIFLEEGESEFVFQELGDEPKFSVRIFYLKSGKTAKIQNQLEHIHETDALHLSSSFGLFILQKKLLFLEVFR